MESKKGKLTTKISKNIFVALMLLYPLVNFVVFYIVVNANSVLMAFQQTDTKTFQATWVGLENFERFFRDVATIPTVGRYILNSIIYFVVLLALGMPFNMFFAYMFFTKIRGTTLMRGALMIPAMVSGLVTAVLFTRFAESALPVVFDKWFDIQTLSLLKDERYNFVTIILYSLLTGFSSNVIIYCNAMNVVTEEMLEATRLDGATHLQTLWFINIPLIIPTITTFMVTGVAGLFACSGGTLYLFYEYDAPHNVMDLGYYIFTMTKNNQAAKIDYSYSSTIGLIFTAVTMPLVLLVKWGMDKLDPYREV